MYSIKLVIHPAKFEKILELMPKDPTLEVKEHYVGCIGMKRYIIKLSDESLLNRLKEHAAVPFAIVLMTDVLDEYPLEDYRDMIDLYMTKVISVKPDGFEIIKFASPVRTIHYYPMYGGDYLYVGKEEIELLSIDPLTLLGLRPISDNPLCWTDMDVRGAIWWGGACLVKSEDVQRNVNLSDQVDTTIAKLNRNMRYIVTDVNRDDENNPAHVSAYFTDLPKVIGKAIGHSCMIGPNECATCHPTQYSSVD